MMRALSDQNGDVQYRLFRVCWRSPVTREHGTSGPMSRAQAEFLVRDEAIGSSLRRFWIEPWIELVEDDDTEETARPQTSRPTRRMN